jgi:hypothetical protein
VNGGDKGEKDIVWMMVKAFAERKEKLGLAA